MPLFPRAASLWRSLLHRSRVEDDLDEELRGYLEALVAKKIDAGLDPASARRDALREIGGIDRVKDAVRDERSGQIVESTLRDVRFAWRGLRRSPGFTAVAVMTLALGIGANTAIFSVVRAMLIAPLPFRDSSQLVFVWADLTASGYPRAPLAGPEVKDLVDRSTLFSGFGAIWATTAALTGADNPEQLRIGWVTTNFFSVLGADAALGRTFVAGDEQQAEAPPRAILLSWATWQRRFGGDPSIVGQRIQVNHQPNTVVGVMPDGFRLLMPPDASVPDDLQAYQLLNPIAFTRARGQQYMRVVARMKPGVTVEQAKREVNGIAAQISREFTDYGSAGRVYNTVGLQTDGVRQLRPVLLALFGGVAILLLIACVNVASLLVARAAARTRETALRMSLGAGYGRLVRQCLVEGLLLASLGAAAGVLVGHWGLRFLLALRPASLERLGTARIDPAVLAFTAGTAVLWGLLFSLAPLAEVFRTRMTAGLQQDGRRSTTGLHRRTRSALVVVQIALSVVLVVSASLITRSFLELQRVNPGFRSDRVLSFRIALPISTRDPLNRSRSREALNEFVRRLQGEITALPGVSSVGAVSHLPYDSLPNWATPYITTPGEDDSQAPMADNRAVTPGFFEAVGARLVAGRFFTDDDDTRVQPVVIVDDQLARRAWPGESAVGKRIASDPTSTGHAVYWATVVGVVHHLRLRSLLEDLGDQVYFAERQIGRNPLAYVVHATGDPTALSASVQRIVARLDPTLPVYDLRPLDEYVVGARAVQRFASILAGAFASVALILAAVGVYGVISYAMTRRRYEFGVRLALGAQPAQVTALVLKEGAVLAGVGLLFGLAFAAGAARLLQSQLFAVSPLDGASYAAGAVAIGAAAIAACWLPARRASAISPLDALRTD
jgi:putative ABC transport system permease protein